MTDGVTEKVEIGVFILYTKEDGRLFENLKAKPSGEEPDGWSEIFN